MSLIISEVCKSCSVHARKMAKITNVKDPFQSMSVGIRHLQFTPVLGEVQTSSVRQSSPMKSQRMDWWL